MEVAALPGVPKAPTLPPMNGIEAAFGLKAPPSATRPLDVITQTPIVRTLASLVLVAVAAGGAVLLARYIMRGASGTAEAACANVTPGDTAASAKCRASLEGATNTRAIAGAVVLAVAGLAIIVALWVAGVPAGTLLAGAGVVTVVVGIGMQSLFESYVGGGRVLQGNMFAVGDMVTLSVSPAPYVDAVIHGRVHAFTLRTTTIERADGTHTFVDNARLALVHNHARDAMGGSGPIEAVVPPSASVSATLASTRDTVLESWKGHPDSPRGTPRVHLTTRGASTEPVLQLVLPQVTPGSTASMNHTHSGGAVEETVLAFLDAVRGAAPPTTNP